MALGKPAAALECLARALVLEPTHREARQQLAVLQREHPADMLGELSTETMTRLRKRAERASARAERGAQQQALAYADAIELLESVTQQLDRDARSDDVCSASAVGASA